MSISAHKLKHAFHVNYNNMLLAKRVLTDSLLTESSQELLTEASATIHSERFGQAKILLLKNVVRTAFFVVNAIEE